MELYLNSVGIISSAGNNVDSGQMLPGTPDYHTTALPAIEPDYKAHIPVMQLRRMSKVVRMGVVAAKASLHHAGIEKTGALSVGTAYGCLQDTESFLGKMIDLDEQTLTPTAFIQSTHNTVSGQIALLTSCYGHNLTFVQGGHSFEHAILNAQLYAYSHPGATILAGGIDEFTPASISALQSAGLCTREPLSPGMIANGNNSAAVVGEGAVFFCAAAQPGPGRHIAVRRLITFKTRDTSEAVEQLRQFAATASQPVLVMSGDAGMASHRPYYDQLHHLYESVPFIQFKQYTGEYPTCSAMALGLLMVQPDPAAGTVLLINNFGSYYSCWEVELSV